MENLLQNNPAPIHSSFFSKRLIILLSTVAALLIITALYFFYFGNFLHFKTLATLSYDAQKAFRLVSNPQSIVFTKGDRVSLSDLKGDELLLASGGNSFNKKMAGFRISKSRQFITWQSEAGIVGLNVLSRKVFLIYAGKLKQSYDLSPINDRILFVSKDQLIEADLSNSRITKRLALPKIDNPAAQFNHLKYDSTATLAYIRAIHELPKENVPGMAEDAVVDLQKGQMSFLAAGFSDSVSLAPLWSKDSSQLLAWRGQKGLITYTLADQTMATLIRPDDFSLLGPYALSPDGKTIAYAVKKDQIKIPDQLPSSELFGNTQISLFDQASQLSTPLINEIQLSSQGIHGFISDIGWLGNEQLWLMVTQGRTTRQMWVINRNNAAPSKIMEDFDQYSLDSSQTPVTETYTLYER